MTIGQRIQRERKSKGLTQKELAAAIGLATGTVQQYELDKRRPKFEHLRGIADTLNIPVGRLIEPSFSELVEEESLRIYLGGIESHMQSLNARGQKFVADFAITVAQDLARIPEYQKSPPAASQGATEGK